MAMQMIHFGSSWVDSAGYDSGDLYIQYRDAKGKLTVLCHYPDIPFELWMDFLAAPSKGKWIHANIIHKPYTVIG